MIIALKFSHDEKDAACVSMSVDGGTSEDFDYVAFVKAIFANPNAQISSEVDNSYTDEQKTQLEAMVKKFEEKARGAATEDAKEVEGQDDSE